MGSTSFVLVPTCSRRGVLAVLWPGRRRYGLSVSSSVPLARTVGVPAPSPSAEVKGAQRSSDPLRRAVADCQGAQAIACYKLADHFRAYARRDALQQPC